MAVLEAELQRGDSDAHSTHRSGERTGILLLT